MVKIILPLLFLAAASINAQALPVITDYQDGANTVVEIVNMDDEVGYFSTEFFDFAHVDVTILSPRDFGGNPRDNNYWIVNGDIGWNIRDDFMKFSFPTSHGITTLSGLHGLTLPAQQTPIFQLVGYEFTYNLTSVPEPTTTALMAFGLAGIGFARKKKLN
jgi:hypothetical protein